MPGTQGRADYHSTGSKYKGGAREMYVTYDLEQATRGDNTAIYPKVKRVYVAGDVTDWEVGDFEKRSGRSVPGVKIDYEQTREGYDRAGYTAKRSDTGTEYHVEPTHVEKSVSHFTHIIEVPDDARNVKLHQNELPERYQHALQNVT